MNEDVRKLNHVKLKKKKAVQKPKNLTVKLSTGTMKPDRSKVPLSTKGSFVHEFKKIRKEIEDELKREESKFRTKVNTACASPKNMTHSLISKPIEDPESCLGNASRKRSIRKFMKLKKKKFKKEKILERSQEINRHFKVKENLKILNKYVKHIRAQSMGFSYPRTTGLHVQRKKINSKLYNGFIKAKTPKNREL